MGHAEDCFTEEIHAYFKIFHNPARGLEPTETLEKSVCVKANKDEKKKVTLLLLFYFSFCSLTPCGSTM